MPQAFVMSKTYKILLFFLISILVLLTYLEAMEPEEINWNPSYTAADKIPLGAYILFEFIQEQPFSVEKINLPPYEFLKQTSPAGTYIFLNNRLDFHDSELNELLSWIEKGNKAYLIAESFSSNILDTLDLKIKISAPGKDLSSKPIFNLTIPGLEADEPFLLDKETYNFTFRSYDTLEQRLVGVSQLYRDTLKITRPEAHFLMDSIGKGVLFIHTSPKAFSNFFIIEGENYKYAERALAFISPEDVVYWDAYYKSGKAYQSSPLYILLNSKALKWAYYFIIAGSILFILFEGKRKQRSIPVIRPLQNQSYHFTRTIAGLYLNQKDYKEISSKKIHLFLDYVRTKYHLTTDEVNDHFYERLAGLSGNRLEDVKKLWDLMLVLQNKQQVEKEDLLELNRKINAFKKRKHGK